MKIENNYCEIIADATELTQEDWLEQRREGIGGSDVGALMGLNKYKSAMMVYLEKLGIAPENQENDAMKHGKRMEPVLRREFPELYKEETGIEIVTQESPFVYQSKGKVFMRGNIDGVVIHPEHDLCGLEVKTTSPWNAKEWAEDCVPDTYYAQIQHYIYILGLERFFVPVLIGSRFEFREVPRNQAFITRMLLTEKWFWEECIGKKQMPAPSGIENENDYLLHIYKNANEIILSTPEIEQDIIRYLELNDSIKAYKNKKEELALKFKSIIGEAKGLEAGSHRVTWSRFEQRRFDTDAFKKKYPDIYEMFSSKKQSSRLTVK